MEEWINLGHSTQLESLLMPLFDDDIVSLFGVLCLINHLKYIHLQYIFQSVNPNISSLVLMVYLGMQCLLKQPSVADDIMHCISSIKLLINRLTTGTSLCDKAKIDRILLHFVNSKIELALRKRWCHER